MRVVTPLCIACEPMNSRTLNEHNLEQARPREWFTHTVVRFTGQRVLIEQVLLWMSTRCRRFAWVQTSASPYRRIAQGYSSEVTATHQVTRGPRGALFPVAVQLTHHQDHRRLHLKRNVQRAR